LLKKSEKILETGVHKEEEEEEEEDCKTVFEIMRSGDFTFLPHLKSPNVREIAHCPNTKVLLESSTVPLYSAEVTTLFHNSRPFLLPCPCKLTQIL